MSGDFHSISIEVRDALYKTEIYLNKIVKTVGSFGQLQKICHLTAQSCNKFYEIPEFNIKVYSRIDQLIGQTRNYFIMYLLDILIKNSRIMLKLAKGDILEHFKKVWGQAWQQPKNSNKLQCLKAIARTYKIVYPSDKLSENIESWVFVNYDCTLDLGKYEDQYSELLERSKSITHISNSASKKLES